MNLEQKAAYARLVEKGRRKEYPEEIQEHMTNVWAGVLRTKEDFENAIDGWCIDGADSMAFIRQLTAQAVEHGYLFPLPQKFQGKTMTIDHINHLTIVPLKELYQDMMQRTGVYRDTSTHQHYEGNNHWDRWCHFYYEGRVWDIMNEVHAGRFPCEGLKLWMEHKGIDTILRQLQYRVGFITFQTYAKGFFSRYNEHDRAILKYCGDIYFSFTTNHGVDARTDLLRLLPEEEKVIVDALWDGTLSEWTHLCDDMPLMVREEAPLYGL